MSHKQMRFQVTSKLIRPNSWITQTVRQRIPNCWARNGESTSTESAGTDAWNDELTATGRSQMLATRNRGDRHTVITSKADRIGHATSKIENYMDSSFLNWFQVLSLCAVNEVMPGRRSVFKNWADYCSVEMEKLFIWNSRSLKLLQEIEPFVGFWGDNIYVCGPGAGFWKVPKNFLVFS